MFDLGPATLRRVNLFLVNIFYFLTLLFLARSPDSPMRMHGSCARDGVALGTELLQDVGTRDPDDIVWERAGDGSVVQQGYRKDVVLRSY